MVNNNSTCEVGKRRGEIHLGVLIQLRPCQYKTYLEKKVSQAFTAAIFKSRSFKGSHKISSSISGPTTKRGEEWEWQSAREGE